MNESEIRNWLAMRDELHDKAIHIAESMLIHKQGNATLSIGQHDPEIHWPGDDDIEYGRENVTVAWTEYGAYGSEWPESESFPLQWLWDEDWYEAFKARHEERKRLDAEDKRQEDEAKEQRELEQRRSKYLKLKEEFGEDV